MRSLHSVCILCICAVFLAQCSRKDCGCLPPPDSTPSAQQLSYGDSVLYLKSSDYTVIPKNNRTGTYTAFPDNLLINRNTGAITVTVKGNDGQSQTGMRYKVTFTSGNEVDSTFITLSGITYVDKFYQLNLSDSIIYPVYNADFRQSIPPGDYDIAHDNKFAINPANGQINIKECMRRGFFGSGSGMSWKIATVKYAVSDNSNRVENNIDLVLYYYSTVNDVPSNVSALMQAHRRMTLGLAIEPIPTTRGDIDSNLPSQLSAGKPRPPCIVIIGH